MKSNSPYVRSRGASADISSAMTPMIDVVFLLLVFFVWTASFQTIEYIMPPSELSSQRGTEAADPQEETPVDLLDIVIRISQVDGQPKWRINQQSVQDANAVKQRLAVLSDIDTSVVVIIHPDPNIQLEHVINAYDIALGAGFAKVSFAVN